MRTFHKENSHKKEKDKSDWLQCVLCGEKYSDVRNAKKHILKAHSGEAGAGDIDEHIQGERDRFKCEQCNKKFPMKSTLKKHIQSHENEKDKSEWLQCGLCDRKYSDVDNIKKHILKAHSGEVEAGGGDIEKHILGERKRFKCEQCNRKFSQKSHLKSHLQSHKNEKDKSGWRSCGLCDKKYCDVYKVKDHILKAHSGEVEAGGIEKHIQGDRGRFQCGQCNKKISRKSNLKAHLQSHQNEKDKLGWPSCKLCGKKYSDVRNVKKHILEAHSREVETGGIEKLIQEAREKFRCEQCNKKFSKKGHLKRHLQSHQNEKDKSGWPECGLCGKRYSSRTLVRKHILGVHSDRGK